MIVRLKYKRYDLVCDDNGFQLISTGNQLLMHCDYCEYYFKAAILHLSNDKRAPGCLVYLGDYTTQLYRDFMGF